ncbi:hypothetical protein SteCoe_27495 [Stentor coeruleus]|uniref:Uncharacterized protein n=1 Tax=Stentor coeruleus TaxID=5963 RepID=A0A1R2BAC3_9CILI|nr:hypothetical protein SteCoe_27495 [Stentor coeruleus]
MELDDRFSALMSEIQKQEEVIENYARKLDEDGNIDPSIEEYLTNAREELQQRKVKLIEEFKPKDEAKQSLNLRKSRPSTNEGEFSPKAKSKCNTPGPKSSRAGKLPFYSVHKIEVEKNQVGPKNIFKNNQGTPRGNSPSASRYSPKNNPGPEMIQRKKTFEFHDTLEEIASSTDCSTTYEVSNDYNADFIKFQKMRELRNWAHEEMLKQKELLLKRKEKDLEAMMHYIESNSITLRRGNYSEADDVNDGLDLEKPNFTCFSTCPIKPPKSPQKKIKRFNQNIFMNKNEKKINDLVSSLSGIPNHKIPQIARMCNDKLKPPRSHRRNSSSQDITIS